MRSNGSWQRLSNAALFVLAVGSGVLAWPVSSQVTAQQPPAPAPGQGQRAGQPPAGGQPGGRGRGPIVAPLPFEDRTGFESLFNGTSLNPGEQQEEAARKAAQAAQAAGGGRGRGGAPVSRFQDWDGDPRFWRVENGVIVGESTADKTVNPNTFLIWRGGAPGDFELKVEIRMNSTNSGIQYRSRMIPAAQGLPAGQSGHAWRLAGYQMDMDFDNVYPGQLYEEAGRGFLAERGTITYIAPDGTKGTIGQLKTADELKAAFKPGEWNTFHLIARGNTLIHIVNGLVTAVCVDDDLKGRSMAGLLGFQLHAGAPMKLELRNLAIKLK
jgi:hypothetical protein